MSDVHGTTHGKKHWKNKPLFRREGDKKFRNGQEAADMLYVSLLYHASAECSYPHVVDSPCVCVLGLFII